MSTELTTRERFTRMFEHRDADRVPIFDYPWPTTIERWHKEGLPEGTDFVDYFGLDQVIEIQLDNSPRYPEKVIEETGEYKIYTTSFGITMKQWKHLTSTPEYLDFSIKDRESWQNAKERMTPDPDRIPWERLKKNYRKWRESGHWIQTNLWFGFDVTHAWAVGTEQLLVALVEDPEWCMDMFNHYLDVNLALVEMVMEKGYEFDCAFWWDDMGYKGSQFFSVDMYRELLKPVHKRAIEWAHSRGMKAHLHSCGNVNPFIPELVGVGLDALNPLEVKAGMDPLELKRKYGGDLVLHGGINAVLWEDLEAIEAEIKEVLPGMKENGGYIFSTDHSVPDSVSLEDFRRITGLVKKLGAY
ncbi:MAG: uroporphyrinogen decarboxylase family protein [Gemmatimonadota bacterium]|nr:uroporphyrinogen decarboxylase family protein [Gemmatimonadota bacterium]